MAPARQDNAKRPPALPAEKRRPFLRYCFVLVLVGVALLAWASLVSFSPTDPPGKRADYVYPPKGPCDNAAGLAGAYLAHTLRYWLGAGAYMVLLLVSGAAAKLLRGGRIGDLPWRIVGGALLVFATSSLFYMSGAQAGEDIAEGSAGILGLGAGRFIFQRFSGLGSWVIIAITFCIGLMLTADQLVLRALRGAWAVVTRRGRGGRALGGLVARGVLRGAALGAAAGRNGRAAAGAKLGRAAAGEKAPRAESGAAPGGRLRPLPLPRPPQNVPPQAELAPAKVRPAATARGPRPARQTPRDTAENKVSYELPSLELLAVPSGRYTEAAEVQAMQRKLLLQQTLDDFNVEADVVGFETGPVITLFEVSLSPGVKVSQIASLATDIARALAVPGVRVVPPRFGKDTVGIEVPNIDKETVRIRELMDLAPEAHRRMHLPLYLGKDAAGSAIIADLAAMPHLLMAGTTGSGKSVSINAIIMAMLMLRTPEQVRLILVDPKMVEMAAFEEIPHLLCPIVNDMRKAAEILEWAATKMDERYELFKEAGVKNIAGYNQLGEKELYERFGVEDEQERARIPKRLQHYVIIIDELADLVMTADKEVEGHIIRIAQKARAVGIHLILATQRPSVNVVTGLIKANMPCRISFRVASRQESRIVLDQNGAEVLLGQGDMLFLQPGSSTPLRAQGTYVDESEIRSVVQSVRRASRPQYDAELARLNSRPAGQAAGERDELFDQAAEIVLATKRGSVSLLQRRLQVGYTRASRIIDQMADVGILGDYKGSQARECLMTLDDWQQLQESIAADQSGRSALNGQPTSV